MRNPTTRSWIFSTLMLCPWLLAGEAGARRGALPLPADGPRAARARKALSPEHRDELLAEIAARGRAVALVALEDPRATADTMPPATPERLAEVRAIEERLGGLMGGGHVNVRHRFATFPGAIVDIDSTGLRRLAAHADVTAVHPDMPVIPSLAESVPLIRGTAAHMSGQRGAGVGVAVLDSGVNTAHDSFKGALLGDGWHSLMQGQNRGTGGIEDDTGHGSNVAGVIASRGTAGAVGVAPEARLFIAKVLDPTGGWSSDWAAAVDYVTMARNDFDVPIRIINMSLGTTRISKKCPCNAESVVFYKATQAARASGLALYAAAGNEGTTEAVPIPSCFSTVLTIGATYDDAYGRSPDAGTYQSKYGGVFAACFDTSAKQMLACFSNRNACVKLMAPGAAISAPYIGKSNSIGTYYGTSQAAPHASGVAAQVLGAYPSLVPDALDAALLGSRQAPVSDGSTGKSYPFLDSIDAVATGKCLAGCPVGPCELPDCDLQGACRKKAKPAGSSCKAPTCENGMARTYACDAQGACVVSEPRPCGAFACDPTGTECLIECFTDADCEGDAVCRNAGCVPRACADGNDCTGGCNCAVGAAKQSSRPRNIDSLMAVISGIGVLALALRSVRRRRRR